MDDHGSGTSPRIVAIAPQAWSEASIGLIKKDSTKIARRSADHPTIIAAGRHPALLLCFGGRPFHFGALHFDIDAHRPPPHSGTAFSIRPPSTLLLRFCADAHRGS